MTRHVHIDGDVLLYETAFASQKTHYHLNRDDALVQSFPNSDSCKVYCAANELDYRALRAVSADAPACITTTLEVLPESVCRLIFKEKLSRILNKCEASEHTIHMSGDSNFRTTVAVTKPYKGNRIQPKPVHYEHVKEMLRSDPRAAISINCEADDDMAMSALADGGVISTIDKDLNSVEGLHHDWNLGIKYKVSVALARWFFCYQMLRGDTVDNIPGVPGLGDKKIEKLIGHLKDSPIAAWSVVLAEYGKGPFKVGGVATAPPEQYLLEQGQLLWMQRSRDEKWSPAAYEEKYLPQT